MLKAILILFFFCSLVGAGLTACASDARVKRVETLLSEISQLSESNANSIDAIPKDVMAKLRKDSIMKFPSNRNELEEAANIAIPYYDADRKRFLAIAAKYDEMKTLNLNDKYLASVSKQQQLFELYAKGVMLQKARLELLLDRDIKDRATLLEKSSEIEKQEGQVRQQVSTLQETK